MLSLCHLISMLLQSQPSCLGLCVPLPLRLLHIAYIRRRMTLGCWRVAAEERDWKRGKEDGWYKRDYKWAGEQRGCDGFSESVDGISARRGKFSDAHNIVDAIANACVFSVLAQLIWKSLVQPCQSVITVRALPLSLALYLPPYSNEMGWMAGPRMSQQNGNQCVLIKATNLQTTTSKKLCRFSSFSPRAILMTKKDLRRLS